MNETKNYLHKTSGFWITVLNESIIYSGEGKYIDNTDKVVTFYYNCEPEKLLSMKKSDFEYWFFPEGEFQVGDFVTCIEDGMGAKAGYTYRVSKVGTDEYKDMIRVGIFNSSNNVELYLNSSRFVRSK